VLTDIPGGGAETPDFNTVPITCLHRVGNPKGVGNQLRRRPLAAKLWLDYEGVGVEIGIEFDPGHLNNSVDVSSKPRRRSTRDSRRPR
jgi:hypothetical protein